MIHSAHPVNAPSTAAPLFEGCADANGRRPLQGLSPSVLKRVTDYIGDHIDENISLERLAAVACMSRFHFARLFRHSSGLSPMEYVKRERIELAKQLLARREVRISAIAVEVGFFDQSHFTRVFRKLTGMSPGRYSRHLQTGRSGTSGYCALPRQVASARDDVGMLA